MSFLVERVRADLRAGEAAYALDVSRMTLWRWENGKDFPTIQHLTKMAKVYGCTIEDLLENDRRAPYDSTMQKLHRTAL